MKIGDYYVGIACKCAIAGVTVLTLATAFSTAAIAVDPEQYPLFQGVRFGEIPYRFEERFFSNSPDFATNRTLTGQLKRIFGPYPENSFFRDSRAVNEIYSETQYRQMNSGPIIRTADLPNPFQFSLRTLPPPVIAAPLPSGPPTTIIVTPPVTAPTNPARPVPALW